MFYTYYLLLITYYLLVTNISSTFIVFEPDARIAAAKNQEIQQSYLNGQIIYCSTIASIAEILRDLPPTAIEQFIVSLEPSLMPKELFEQFKTQIMLKYPQLDVVIFKGKVDIDRSEKRTIIKDVSDDETRILARVSPDSSVINFSKGRGKKIDNHLFVVDRLDRIENDFKQVHRRLFMSNGEPSLVAEFDAVKETTGEIKEELKELEKRINDFIVDSTKRSQESKNAIKVALIGAIATILAGTIAADWVGSWLNRNNTGSPAVEIRKNK